MSFTFHESHSGARNPFSTATLIDALNGGWHWLIGGCVAGAVVMGTLILEAEAPVSSPLPGDAAIVLRDFHLNGLRDVINAEYGFLNGGPRINQGPCVAFALAFQSAWNQRFHSSVSLAVVCTEDERRAFHVLIVLPDGAGFDGGRGVIPDSMMPELLAGEKLLRMESPDVARLEQFFGPVDRRFPRCPNYDEELTRMLIATCLDRLKRQLRAGS